MQEKKEFYKKAQVVKKIFKDKEANFALTNWLETELAYTSNHIEGNTLTRQETTLAIKGLTSGAKPLKDYLEAQNHARAFNQILKVFCKQKTLSQDTILKIHKIILSGINDDFAGRYRNVPVRISGSSVLLPSPARIYDLMVKFVKDINTQKDTFEAAILGHLQFVSIHPFIDGNGRVGRLLMNLLLIKGGYPPPIIRLRDRKRYLQTIEHAQLTGDILPYKTFMFKILERSFDTYIEMFCGKNISQPPKDLLTIGQFAKLCGVPVSTIRYYLRIGKIKPLAKTAGDYMLFSPKQKSQLK